MTKTNTKIFTTLIFFSCFLCFGFLFTACSTIKPVALSYVENENVDVAYINFQMYKRDEISGATYITYDNKETPKPEKLTYWSPVEVPANTALKLHLHISYKEPRTDCGDDSCFGAFLTALFNSFEAARDVNRDIVFNVPPLEPYEDYTISYEKGPGIPGSSYVTLRRDKTNEVIRELEFN